MQKSNLITNGSVKTLTLKEAMEELKQKKRNLQTENDELKMHLHEEKEEKQGFLLSCKQRKRAWKSYSETHVR